MGSGRLDDATIASRLETLDGWCRRGDAIFRRFLFADFEEAMTFIGRVADIARGMDHHPELFNVYNRVELVMTTHDAHGITEKDLAFAQAVNALPEAG